MTFYAAIFLATFVLSALVLRRAISYAHRLGVMDRPGGHKAHTHVTPFVGGIAVFVAFVAALVMLAAQGMMSFTSLLAMGVGGVVMFVTGFADDVWHLSYKPRLLLQASVALLMVYVGGICLTNLGRLLTDTPLDLGWLAVPFTVFATVGVINALNMIDGIDGLSGSITFATLTFIAVVANQTGNGGTLLLAVMLMGGVAAFLWFNLRRPGQPRARTFLGDNGTMLLGFCVAWLLISLSQGVQRTIPPVLALWLFAIPLMDTIGIMVRRMWLGRSPFRPDRHHVHHLFLRAGYRVEETVHAIALLHFGLGVAGLTMHSLGVAESTMLIAFMLSFGAYFYVILRPWRFVPLLRKVHRLLDLPSRHAAGVVIGRFPLQQAPTLAAVITRVLNGRQDIRFYRLSDDRSGVEKAYAIIRVQADVDVELKPALVRRLQKRIRQALSDHKDIEVRQYIERNAENDRRTAHKPVHRTKRRADRRRAHQPIPVFVSPEIVNGHYPLAA